MTSDERQELEGRIDHALAVARSSERAAIEIGAAALDAADQARRAADLAAAIAAGGMPPQGNGHGDGIAPEADPLRHFTERADRVMARLRVLV